MSDSDVIKLYKWLVAGGGGKAPRVDVSKFKEKMDDKYHKKDREEYKRVLRDAAGFSAVMGTATSVTGYIVWRLKPAEQKISNSIWPLGAFFLSLENNFDNLIYAGPDTDSDEFVNFVNALATKTGNGDVSTGIGGLEFANKIGIVNKATSALTSDMWDDIWDSRDIYQKAMFIFEYLKIKVLTGKVYPGVPEGVEEIPQVFREKDNVERTQNYVKVETRDVFSQGGGLGEAMGFSRPRAPLYADAPELTSYYYFPTMINELFLGEQSDIKLETNLKDQESLIAQAAKAKEIDTAAADAESKSLAALKEIGLDNLKGKGALADLETKLEPGDEDFAKRDAFFKQIEQCILLTSVDKLGEYRKEIRKKKYDEYVSASAGFKPWFPYGGKIIPVSISGSSFINFANSDDNLYNYTTKLLTELDNNCIHNFSISKLNTVNIEGYDYEIEMPLIFEGMSNVLNPNPGDPNEGETHEAYSRKSKYLGTNIIVGQKTAKVPKSTESLMEGVSKTTANQLITINDVTIKYEGETQATAKSNVDVEISIGVKNLLQLQSVFQNRAYYIDRFGNPREYEYEYQLIDLMTYLHRSDMGDVYASLTTEGGRLYNPTYFKNYNRLIMKIIPKEFNFPTFKDFTSKKAATQVQYRNAYKEVKNHHVNSPLILDLALIDHTIKKQSKSQDADITLTYKGYIKSFLQDPKFDVLRTNEEIETEIEEERKLLDGYVDDQGNNIDGLKDVDGEKAIEMIDEFNKAKETRFTGTKGIPYLNKLISRDKYYTLEINSNTFVNNVTKDYELLNSNLINAQIDPKTQIYNVTQELTESQDPIADTVTANTKYKVNFFYFGDLIDVAMESIYKYRGPMPYGNPPRDRRRTHDPLHDTFKRFPIKIILPSFFPLKPSDDGLRYTRSKNEISVADFPIAESWYVEWWKKEVLDSDVEYYTIGTLVTRLTNELLNGLLVEDCYLNGNHERLQFSVKADFGLFDRVYERETGKFDFLITEFDRQLEIDGPVMGMVDMTNFRKVYGSPYFFKDPLVPRSEYCNFLVVYKQLAVFEDYIGVSKTEKSRKDNNIPIFHYKKKAFDDKETVFTDSIEFSKQESTYMRESRYQADNLSTLAQMASVYDATCVSKPMLSLYPGMLTYIDAGLYQAPGVYNSIANILGLGGLHIIQSVSHTGKVELNQIDLKTDTSCVWVSNDTLKRNNRVIIGGTEKEPKTPSTKTYRPDNPYGVSLPKEPLPPDEREKIEESSEPVVGILEETLFEFSGKRLEEVKGKGYGFYFEKSALLPNKNYTAKRDDKVLDISVQNGKHFVVIAGPQKKKQGEALKRRGTVINITVAPK
mgnify:CR=1 FL=1|tara:strand:+ start:4619 stop:8614 length:3996 start_codon:yes stop_codon:yes gene_type:complete